MLEKAVAQPGDVVLILRAKRSVGKAAAEIVKARRLKIITTLRTDGADVNVTTGENLQQVLDFNGAREPNIILDYVGSPVLMEKSLVILGNTWRYVFTTVMRGGGHGVNSWSLSLAEARDVMINLSNLFDDGKLNGPEEDSLFKVSIADARGCN